MKAYHVSVFILLAAEYKKICKVTYFLCDLGESILKLMVFKTHRVKKPVPKCPVSYEHFYCPWLSKCMEWIGFDRPFGREYTQPFQCMFPYSFCKDLLRDWGVTISHLNLFLWKLNSLPVSETMGNIFLTVMIFTTFTFFCWYSHLIFH